MELLRDPIWQFVGAVLAMVGIATAIFIASRQIPRKELSGGYLIKRHLVRVSNKVASDIAMTFRGQPVSGLKLYSYGVKNSGSVEIRPNDFERPLEFRVGTGLKILEAHCYRQRPDDLLPEIKHIDDGILVSPMLLNPGDFFVIDFLVTGEGSGVALTHRIAGVSSVKKINSGIRFQKRRMQNSMFNGGFAMLVGVGLYFVAKASGEKDAWMWLLGTVGAAAMMFLLNGAEWLIGRFTNNNSRYIDDV